MEIVPRETPLQAWANVLFEERIRVSEAGAPLDLTSLLIEMQIREFAGAPDPAAISIDSSAVSGSRIIKTDAAAGEFMPTITSADLEDMIELGATARDYTLFAYDILINSRIYFYGQFKLWTGVTR